MFLLLSIISYILLLVLSLKMFLLFTPPVFLLVIYILPVAINVLVTYFQSNQKFKQIVTLVLPALSSVFYLLFAYITENTGTWNKFIELNTISDGNVTVEISKSLLDINQITFMLLVYWGTMIIQYVVLKRKNSVYVEGKNYA